MKIETIRDLKALDEIQSFWEEWQYHPNNDFEHFKMVCELRDEVLSPFVVVAKEGNRITALLAARMERTHFSPSIGYFKPFKIPVTSLTFIHEGLLGEVDNAMADQMIRYIFSELSSGVADVADFSHLNENASLLKAILNSDLKRLYRGNPQWTIRWDMDIPDCEGALLKNMKSKHRGEMRRRERRLFEKFSGKAIWRWLDRFENISLLCERLEALVALTYHRGLGVGFKNNEEHQKRFEIFADRGLLRMQIFEVEGRIHAYWMGILYKDIFYVYDTGYDSSLRDFRLGTLTFIQKMDNLIRENNVKQVDFGMGDAHYKARFASRSVNEATIRLFAPNMKGVMINLTHGLFRSIDGISRKVLEQSGFLDRFKRAWRQRLAERNV